MRIRFLLDPEGPFQAHSLVGKQGINSAAYRQSSLRTQSKRRKHPTRPGPELKLFL
jgi:hypothetical protein